MEDEIVEIELVELPPTGIHFLQVQNPDSLFSNDFIFHVAEDEEDVRAFAERAEEPRPPAARPRVADPPTRNCRRESAARRGTGSPATTIPAPP